jgi:hypothetical protein
MKMEKIDENINMNNNKILYDTKKENKNIIDFQKQQYKDIEKLTEKMKEFKKEYQTININIVINKKKYYNIDNYKLFYYTIINKYFVLLYVIKNKNIFEKFHHTIHSEIDNLQHFLHELSTQEKGDKTDIVLNAMKKFNEIYSTIENNENPIIENNSIGNAKDLSINDYYLYCEKNHELINSYIHVYIHVKDNIDKKNEFHKYFNNDNRKYIFLNIMKNNLIFTEFIENMKYLYMLYFRYYLQEKFPSLDFHQYVDTQLYKWNTKDYEFDDISIIYLYYHYKRIYLNVDIEEIEFELDKIKSLYNSIL